MKILHTSDWHLGKKLESLSRIEEQREVMKEILEIAERESVDVVLIAGDIFDTYNPSTEAEELYYKTIKRLSRDGSVPVIVIAGNHDSPERIDAPRPLAVENGIIVVGEPNQKLSKFKTEKGIELIKSDENFLELKLPNGRKNLRIITVPYTNELRAKEYLESEKGDEGLRKYLRERWKKLSERYFDKKGVNILIGHLLISERFDSLPEEPEGEKPIFKAGLKEMLLINDLPDGLDYVALGHLHRYQVVFFDKYPIVYSGSPLAYGLSESEQDKFVVIVDFNKNPTELKPIMLKKAKKIYRKRFNSINDALDWLKDNQNCFVEITIKIKEYISSDDRKKLLNAHNGIIAIIPEIETEEKQYDYTLINKDIDELFKEFFKRETGKNPNDEIMEIFKEIVNS